MGTRPAPSYANIFMAKKIDAEFEDLASQFGDGINPIRFLKCFLGENISGLYWFCTEPPLVHR